MCLIIWMLNGFSWYLIHKTYGTFSYYYTQTVLRIMLLQLQIFSTQKQIPSIQVKKTYTDLTSFENGLYVASTMLALQDNGIFRVSVCLLVEKSGRLNYQPGSTPHWVHIFCLLQFSSLGEEYSFHSTGLSLDKKILAKVTQVWACNVPEVFCLYHENEMLPWTTGSAGPWRINTQEHPTPGRPLGARPSWGPLQTHGLE